MADTPGYVSNSELAKSISDVVSRWNTRENQMIALLTQSSGIVQVTDGSGTSHDLPSFPQLQEDVAGFTEDLSNVATALQASATASTVMAAQAATAAAAAGDSATSAASAAAASAASASTAAVDAAAAAAVTAAAAAAEVKGDIEALKAAQDTDAIYADTLANLQTFTGSFVGQGAFVLTGTGAGQYRWTGSAWQFLRADMLAGKVGTEELNSAFPKVNQASSYVALGTDLVGNVAAWLVDGNFEARGVTSAMIQKIFGSALESANPRLVPLGHDLAGNVAIWLDDGKLDAAGITPHLKSLLGSTEAVSAPPVGIATDGRSLYAWRSKLASLQRTGVGHVRIMVTGDSWTDRPAIPNALASILRPAWGRSGSGWISVDGTYNLDGITNTRSGWSLYDASTSTAPSRGTGIDGSYIVVTDAVAEWNVGGAECDELRIYYRNHGGVFVYSVDGGEEVTVNCANDGGLGSVVIAGLTYGAHGFKVISVSGTVCICGAFATASTPGVEVIKAGNAGITGARMRRITQYIAPIATDCPPDLVIVVLGTNDYRTGNGGTVVGFSECLDELVAQYRAVSPTCGFIVVAPAQTNGVEAIPLVEFRDAAAKFCQDNGHEFYDMFSDWSDFSTMNGLGMFNDTLHTSDSGALSLCNRLNKLFLEVK